MELESLFTASKWEILQHLSTAPLSPIELAERSSTSLANISQQLKLLELGGLVTSQRISNREKGQPRIKYRLAGEQTYLIAAANNFAEKKLLELSAYNKIILKIWFYENQETRYVLEKAFWSIESLFNEMQGLAITDLTREHVTFAVLSGSLEQEALPTLAVTTPTGRRVSVDFTLAHEMPENAHVLYSTLPTEENA